MRRTTDGGGQTGAIRMARNERFRRKKLEIARKIFHFFTNTGFSKFYEIFLKSAPSLRKTLKKLINGGTE